VAKVEHDFARHLGLTLRQVRSGDYRVNFRDGNETTTAFYTDNLEDAVNTAVEMARRRVQRESRYGETYALLWLPLSAATTGLLSAQI